MAEPSQTEIEQPQVRERKEFTPHETTEFREAFNLFDRDEDGFINYKEFSTIMRAFGQQYEDLDLSDMFTEADQADSGLISFEQLIKIFEFYYEEDNSEEAFIKAFKAFDKDGVGYIDKAELKDIMLNYGDKMTTDEFMDFIIAADSNDEGLVRYDSFVKSIYPIIFDE